MSEEDDFEGLQRKLDILKQRIKNDQAHRGILGALLILAKKFQHATRKFDVEEADRINRQIQDLTNQYNALTPPHSKSANTDRRRKNRPTS